jgi:hypothetical protein
VQWLNKDAESRAAYDFIVTEPPSPSPAGGSRTTFVEVKTTRFCDLNVFEISLWEWRFAVSEPRVNYHLYRVYNASDPTNCRVVIYKDLLRLLEERKIKLCLAV